MSNEEKILEMLSEMKADMVQMKVDMAQMKQDIATIKDDLADLKEEHSMTREGVNKLLGWADTAGYIIRFPLDKAN